MLDFIDLPILNHTTLNALKDTIGEQGADEFFNHFLSLIEDVSKNAQDAIEKKDAETLSKNCHKLKSSMRSLGAEKFGAVCEAIEISYEEGRIENIWELEDDYHRIQSQTKSELYLILDKPS